MKENGVMHRCIDESKFFRPATAWFWHVALFAGTLLTIAACTRQFLEFFNERKNSPSGI
jgi:hypothetical protein